MNLIILEKIREKYFVYRRKLKLTNYDSFISQNPLRLNLGCGKQHLKGWVNIDVSNSSIADIVIDFRKLKFIFRPNSIDEILMIHSISYLRLWESQDFFKEILSLLKPNGDLILEFPDITKCAKHLIKYENNTADYLEGVRAFYAFDLQQNILKENYTTYNFGWSAWHMKLELEKLGYKNIKILNPQNHGKRDWRDTRIEASK